MPSATQCYCKIIGELKGRLNQQDEYNCLQATNNAMKQSSEHWRPKLHEVRDHIMRLEHHFEKRRLRRTEANELEYLRDTVIPKWEAALNDEHECAMQRFHNHYPHAAVEVSWQCDGRIDSMQQRLNHDPHVALQFRWQCDGTMNNMQHRANYYPKVTLGNSWQHQGRLHDLQQCRGNYPLAIHQTSWQHDGSRNDMQGFHDHYPQATLDHDGLYQSEFNGLQQPGNTHSQAAFPTSWQHDGVMMAG